MDQNFASHVHGYYPPGKIVKRNKSVKRQARAEPKSQSTQLKNQKLAINFKRTKIPLQLRALGT